MAHIFKVSTFLLRKKVNNNNCKMQKKNLQNVQQINYQQNLSLEKQNGNKMQKQKYKKKLKPNEHKMSINTFVEIFYGC